MRQTVTRATVLTTYSERQAPWGNERVVGDETSAEARARATILPSHGDRPVRSVLNTPETNPAQNIAPAKEHRV